VGKWCDHITPLFLLLLLLLLLQLRTITKSIQHQHKPCKTMHKIYIHNREIISAHVVVIFRVRLPGERVGVRDTRAPRRLRLIHSRRRRRGRHLMRCLLLLLLRTHKRTVFSVQTTKRAWCINKSKPILAEESPTCSCR